MRWFVFSHKSWSSNTTRTIYLVLTCTFERLEQYLFCLGESPKWSNIKVHERIQTPKEPIKPTSSHNFAQTSAIFAPPASSDVQFQYNAQPTVGEQTILEPSNISLPDDLMVVSMWETNEEAWCQRSWDATNFELLFGIRSLTKHWNDCITTNGIDHRNHHDN